MIGLSASFKLLLLWCSTKLLCSASLKPCDNHFVLMNTNVTTKWGLQGFGLTELTKLQLNVLTTALGKGKKFTLIQVVLWLLILSHCRIMLIIYRLYINAHYALYIILCYYAFIVTDLLFWIGLTLYALFIYTLCCCCGCFFVVCLFVCCVVMLRAEFYWKFVDYHCHVSYCECWGLDQCSCNSHSRACSAGVDLQGMH